MSKILLSSNVAFGGNASYLWGSCCNPADMWMSVG